MEEEILTQRWINVVCEDIDGSCPSIPIARFGIKEGDKAITLALALYEHNGSVKIEFEDF